MWRLDQDCVADLELHDRVREQQLDQHLDGRFDGPPGRAPALHPVPQ
jgi:hypothetical protein